jgi:phage baseplate assembly protein W
MPSLSPKLPLALDSELGYQMNKSFIEVVRQNLTMLILTSPGERVMIPDFGVGLKRYLFENVTPSLKDSIRQKIKEQVGLYMPAVLINKIVFDESEMNSNKLFIGIQYSVPSAGLNDSVLLPISVSGGAY